MVFVLFCLGLCIGSFLNVLADRLPRGEDVLWGRSHCDFCKHKLKWYELIPLFSYISQSGRSRCCRKKLSIQYPLSELATGVGFVLIFYALSNPQSALRYPAIPQVFIVHYLLFIILFSSLFVIFISDLKYEIIPMETIISGYLSAICIHLLNYTNLMDSTNYFLSGLFSGLFFFCLWFFSKGKAMGDGDIYLASLLGFLIGFPYFLIFLYGAFLTGALLGIILILGRKKSLKAHIPFGPFLIVGYGVTLLWGDTILRIWRLLW